jgi:sulfopyruvate decarboxylase subunit beta
VALAQERPVIALDGDGAILMNLGTLVTIAAQAPAHYTLVILDNGAYGSTGYQDTSIGQHGDLEGLARAAGNGKVVTVSTMPDFRDALKQALASREHYIIITRVSREHEKFPLVGPSSEEIKNRFMNSIAK